MVAWHNYSLSEVIGSCISSNNSSNNAVRDTLRSRALLSGCLDTANARARGNLSTDCACSPSARVMSTEIVFL